MIRAIGLLAVLAVGVVTIQPAAAADAVPWQAGVASEVITPEEPLWMSGYGSRTEPATGKLSELYAKALFLQDSAGNSAVVMTFDLCGLDRRTSLAIRQGIERECGLPVERIVLFSSHTHSGPVVGDNLRAMYFMTDEQWRQIDAYTRRLIDRSIRLAMSAQQKLEPVELRWGNGRCGFAVNRRENPEEEVAARRAEGNLRGPVDHDVPVLAVKSIADGKLKAVVFGYACHATVLSGQEWSGDWPGYAQAAIEEATGATALFWPGCGADQNPIPRRTVEHAQDYGGQLAESVQAVLGGDMPPLTGTLQADYNEVSLQFASVPTLEQLEATLQSENRFEVGRAALLLNQMTRPGGISPVYPYPIQCWKLGNGPVWIMLGGEVVVDFSIRFKTAHGLDETWVGAYANDVMAYIPSLRVLREGRYEGADAMLYYGQPSAWTESVEEDIATEVARQVHAVQMPAE